MILSKRRSLLSLCTLIITVAITAIAERSNDSGDNFDDKSSAQVQRANFYQGSSGAEYNHVVDPKIDVHNDTLVSVWTTVKGSRMKVDFQLVDTGLWTEHSVRVIKDEANISTLDINGYSKKCHYQSITENVFATLSNCNGSWSGIIVIKGEMYVLRPTDPIDDTISDERPEWNRESSEIAAETISFDNKTEEGVVIIDPQQQILRSNLSLSSDEKSFDLDLESLKNSSVLFSNDSDSIVYDDNNNNNMNYNYTDESIELLTDIEPSLIADKNESNSIVRMKRDSIIQKEASASFCGVNGFELEEKLGDETVSSSETAAVLNSYSSEKSYKWWENLVLELAVFVDQYLWNKFERMYGDRVFGQLEDFVTTIMHNVQLFYNHPSINPKIKFKIVRYEIFKSQPREMRGISDALEYLNAFCDYQYRWKGRNWDHGLLLTGVDLTRHGNDHDISGIARMNGVCDPLNACMLSEAADFRAAFITAHELGHSLGMNHDEPACGDQFIMSTVLGGGKVMWSTCSVNDFHKFLHKLNNQNRNCLLYDTQNSILRVPAKYLPGQRYDINKQCELMHGNGFRGASIPPYSDRGICHMIWCQHVHGGKSYTSHPALEGSECKPGKYCISGKCIPATSRPNIIHGGWTHWSAPMCDACPCAVIRGTLPVVKSTRTCTNPEPMNGGAVCHGDNVVGFICSRNSRCRAKDRRLVSVDEYLEARCTTRKTYMKQHQLTGMGTQIVHYPEKACRVFCNIKSKSTTKSYRFFGDHLPDGTPCGSDKHCLAGKCLSLNCQGRVLSSPATVCAQLPPSCPQQSIIYSVSSPAAAAAWTSWSRWSTCSQACGRGFRTRVRDCRLTKSASQSTTRSECPGHDAEKMSCVGTACYVSNQYYRRDDRESYWTSWSACSATCGQGVQARQKVCLSWRCPGSRTEERPCDLKSCTNWGGWGDWSFCSSDRKRRRIRECYGPDKNCHGSHEEIISC